MARFVRVNGTLVGVGDVYQDGPVQLTGPSQGSPLESGVVAIVATGAGVLQPKVPYSFNSPRSFRELLKSGDLYDAARFVTKPSRDANIRGASRVVAVRVNPATQGTLTLRSSAPANLITLTSEAYGAIAAGIAVTVEAGTQGAFGRKLTISQFGEGSEIADDLGFLPAAILRYTGNATTATTTITNTSLATTLAGDQSDGTVALSVAFSTYDTLEKLANYVNAQTGYEMIVFSSRPSTFLCSTLDYVSGQNIKTKTGTVSTASETATTFSAGSISGLAANDVIDIGTEYLFCSNATGPVLIRGYGDTTAATHSSAAATTYAALTSTTQQMIDWVNTNSDRLTAVRASTSNVGYPATLAKTYLTGAGEGSASNSDWLTAIESLRNTKVNYIVVCSDSSTVHGYLDTHMDYVWGAGGKECLAWSGTAALETKSQIRQRCRALNSENIGLAFQSVEREDDDGVTQTYAPWAFAAMCAGIQAGTPIGTPLTYKSLYVSNVTQNSAIDLVDDANDFVAMGATFARFDDDDWRIARSLTTYTGTDDQHMISPNVRTAIAWTIYKVRVRLKQRHLGQRGLTGDALAIRSTVSATLEECRDVDQSIVEGSRLVNSVREVIPAFRDITVTASGNVKRVSYTITPVDGTDFLLPRTFVEEFQDAA